MLTRYLPAITLVLLSPLANVNAQCGVGELEVTIEVATDAYGNETYWQLVETGNACDESPLFIGGNTVFGCAEAGTEISPDGGYANNTTIVEGPFCLIDGGTYDIISIDCYGDAQATFTVLVEGGFIGQFQADGGSATHTFTVATPLERDMGLIGNTTGFYGEEGLPMIIAGTVQNLGSVAVTTFVLGYSFDGGAEELATISGVDLSPGEQLDIEHEVPWTPTAAGTNELSLRIVSVNGDGDQNTANDALGSNVIVNPAVPDIMDDYLAAAPSITVVATGDQDILVPRDLDFHPDRTRNELWVINKDVFNTGGSTVRFFNPGAVDQTYLYQRDPAARHFLSLPTGIAMGDNGNFATCPGIYDANGNQTTTTPFTGPTLWSADPAVYAQTGFGPLGSHLDMCHVSPRSQGIAHERWNRYWLVDGHNQDVVKYDFRADHGPGNDYHGNAIIHRYPEVSITRDPNDHIVSHCVVDKQTNWLYVVDHGGQRILRLDIRSGSIAAGAPAFVNLEPYVEYENMTGTTWEVVVTTGLLQPAGIDVVGDHLLVSDHATGEIIIYDMVDAFTELGRIATGTPGLMGIKVGPDGRIWGVNSTSSTLVRVDPAEGVGVTEMARPALRLHPNPTSDVLFLTVPTDLALTTAVQITDATGRVCMNTSVGSLMHGLDLRALANGSYAMIVPGHPHQRFVVTR